MAAEAILIVDDNPVNMKLLRVLLAGEGYAVRTAADAHQALKAIREFRPDMILMDIQFPDIDGPELTRQLKSDPATQAITILGLTAYAMKGDGERILAVGCDGYIDKPIETRTLPSLIAGYFEKRDTAIRKTG